MKRCEPARRTVRSYAGLRIHRAAKAARRTRACFLALFAVVVLWWSSIKPSNNRDWQTDVAVLPYATMQGKLVTIHNIRNFNYRTETDFDARYYLYS